MKRRDIKTMTRPELYDEQRRLWRWLAFWIGVMFGAVPLMSIIVGIAERW